MKTNAKLTQAQKEYLETYTTEIIAKEDASTETKAGDSEEVESLVNGSATFMKVLDVSVTKEGIATTIGRE